MHDGRTLWTDEHGALQLTAHIIHRGAQVAHRHSLALEQGVQVQLAVFCTPCCPAGKMQHQKTQRMEKNAQQPAQLWWDRARKGGGGWDGGQLGAGTPDRRARDTPASRRLASSPPRGAGGAPSARAKRPPSSTGASAWARTGLGRSCGRAHTPNASASRAMPAVCAARRWRRCYRRAPHQRGWAWPGRQWRRRRGTARERTGPDSARAAGAS